MKNLTNIYYANWWFFAITLLLYVTIWIGAMLHILFGVFQLVISFYLLYYFKKLTKHIKYQLLLYFFLTVITCIIPFWDNGDNIVIAWSVTWVLALYFIGILYQTTKIKL
jgi:hypothetical protein